MKTQFNREGIYDIPLIDKKYYCSPIISSLKFTYLMKLVLLTDTSKHLIEDIIEYKNIINKQNNNGWTALMIASRNSNTYSSIDTVKELIKTGADINKQNNNSWTALMFACKYSNTDSTLDTVKELIKTGADLNIQESTGWTALMFAGRYSNTDSNLDTVKELIKAGADINKQNNHGWTALTLACRYSNTDSNLDTVKELIKAGADINFNELISLKDIEIDHLLVERYKYDLYKIKNLIQKDKLDELVYQYVMRKEIIKNIIKHKNNIYDLPSNIISLCCQIRFESINEYKDIPSKIKKLFDIKNMQDLKTKTNFYL
jgi:ankyrin repeat protein